MLNITVVIWFSDYKVQLTAAETIIFMIDANIRLWYCTIYPFVHIILGFFLQRLFILTLQYIVLRNFYEKLNAFYLPLLNLIKKVHIHYFDYSCNIWVLLQFNEGKTEKCNNKNLKLFMMYLSTTQGIFISPKLFLATFKEVVHKLNCEEKQFKKWLPNSLEKPRKWKFI